MDVDKVPPSTSAQARPAISPPLNIKKILKAKSWVATAGKRWCIRDCKRLMLNITPSKRSGAVASWVWRRELNGRARDHGLGSWPETSIERARELALDTERRFRETRVSPIDLRRQERSRAAVVRTTQLTFGQAAAQFLQQKLPDWRSVKTANEWRANILGTTPTGAPSDADWCRRLRPVLLSDVTPALIIATLEERWNPATGPRVASAISRVFSWAVARQLREPPNPADWSVISQALTTPSSKRVTPHHPAMPWKEVPAFFTELQRRPDLTAKALMFLIICAGRTTEVRGARWDEIEDLEGPAPTWVVPPERMKGGREHKVPLAPAAVALLKALPREPDNPLIFPASRSGRMMAHDTMLCLLAEMRTGVTPHGFRSTFSDFSHEHTPADPLIIESCLAHAVGDKVARAYRRGNLIEKRTQLMGWWAAYLVSGEVASAGATVVPLHGGL